MVGYTSSRKLQEKKREGPPICRRCHAYSFLGFSQQHVHQAHITNGEFTPAAFQITKYDSSHVLICFAVFNTLQDTHISSSPSTNKRESTPCLRICRISNSPQRSHVRHTPLIISYPPPPNIPKAPNRSKKTLTRYLKSSPNPVAPQTNPRPLKIAY